ncbi:hypothetical protein SISSUDRAFT_1042645 [Sistotremastrum suecicum HHB10207 ss-3]|uniref:Uncharacterized protein n=1 Tax=Sistotremastrum suecicum HHB10207 ss-3 TaxID=1314776 RepID=A0A166GDG9_9AGAM|nr:hypothetical protein SISSUDRAFT_1042645 [Sistotremastrum suecicum HHB10207 ss-3]
MTTMFHEETQQFAVVDAATVGPAAGLGVMLCNTTTPVAPFTPIGPQGWQFVQGSNGMVYVDSSMRR